MKEELLPATYKNLFMFIDRAKIRVDNGIIVYEQKNDRGTFFYNIPYLNISILMLGRGTSITNEALIKLGDSRVTVISVTNNFRGHSITLGMDSGENTLYFHKMIENLYIKDKKLEIAKKLLKERDIFTKKYFVKVLTEEYENQKFGEKILEYLPILSEEQLNKNSIEELLGVEGQYMKNIRIAIKKEFDFLKTNEEDLRKRYEIGNSLIYGMSATVLHSLGIPYQLNIFHGRTNAGALKYDIADIIKTIVYLTAHISCNKDSNFWYSKSEEEYVKKLGEFLAENDLLKYLFSKTISSLELKK